MDNWIRPCAPRSVRMYSESEVVKILERADTIWGLDELDQSITLAELFDMVFEAEQRICPKV